MNVRQSFLDQATACSNLGSPFTGRLLTILAELLDGADPIGARVLDWSGDASNCGDAVALRLAGALHALVLENKSSELAAAYPPNDVSNADLGSAVGAALRQYSAQILDWLDSPPQTNEVRRSAVLMAACLELQDMFGLPLVLSELGASGGLNLNWDQYRMDIGSKVFGNPKSPVRLSPEWTGPLPPEIAPQVASRAGCDLNPIDPASDALRLRAYLWPDQTRRIERTEAAIAIAANVPAPVEQADASSWLTSRLSPHHKGALQAIYHTIAWQYFPDATQNHCEATIRTAGERATQESPVAWFRMEADGTQDGAALSAVVWPGGRHTDLGRPGFHGQWVRWQGFTCNQP
ncbi:MAG: DUF2332 family protein [Rhodobacteraceae bacterium]|nr:DUF2332 family protein [Paracoccaceae bacterium]